MALAALLLIAVAAGLWWWAGAVQPSAPSQRAWVPRQAASAAAGSVAGVADSRGVQPQRVAAGDPPQAASASRNAAVLNYDSADNLYALAVRGGDARDPMAAYNGYMATMVCRMHQRSELEALVARGGSDAASAERVGAARLVLRRCAGFFDNDNSANLDLLRRLATKVRAAPGFYWTAAGQGERVLNAQDFVDVVDRGDWHTLGILIQQSTQQGLAPNRAASASDETLLVQFAGSVLAACDLGRNCGPDSIEYASGCALGSNCAGSWEAMFHIGVTPAQWAAMQARRAEVVAAVRRRDAAYFGFRP